MRQQSCDRRFWAVSDGGGSDKTDVTNLDDKVLSKDDLYDALGEDNAEEEPIPLPDTRRQAQQIETEVESRGKEEEESDRREEKDEEDELKELEEELEEPDEEKLELTTPVRRKEILAKYPNLFKDFPYLEKAYYREQQFTEVFPTIEDARAAQDKGQILDTFSKHVMSGDLRAVIRTVKDEDDNSFRQLVDNYLTSLFEVDQTAYYHIISNLNKQTIAQMVQEGKRRNDDSLIGAAAALQQFIFGTGEWSAPTRLAKPQDPNRNALDEERRQYFSERYETARDDLKSRLENSIQATIEQNIDKTNVMTSYVKRAAMNDAMETLQKMVNGDTRFQSLQTKLWEAAANDNFSKASMDRIRSAFVTKAKGLLPIVLKKARNEALKGLGRRISDDTSDVNDGTTRSARPANSRSTTSQSSGRTYGDKAKQIPKGMTTLEFLNKD